VTVCYVHGGVVCIFETHRKEEEVIDGERGFGLPGRVNNGWSATVLLTLIVVAVGRCGR